VWGDEGLDESRDTAVESLVSTRSGDIAWVVSAFQLLTPATYTIHLSVGGSDSELATGTGIDPRSLAIGGNHVYWVMDGQVQSRTLR
jgi:hypothetical protein